MVLQSQISSILCSLIRCCTVVGLCLSLLQNLFLSKINVHVGSSCIICSHLFTQCCLSGVKLSLQGSLPNCFSSLFNHDDIRVQEIEEGLCSGERGFACDHSGISSHRGVDEVTNSCHCLVVGNILLTL